MFKRIVVLAFLFGCTLCFVLGSNSVFTTFVAYYPDANLAGQKLYIRGDGCNLTWTKGIVLNQTAPNQWKTALLCTQNIVINVKLLANDSVWMFGKNEVFKGGVKTVQIYPSFKPTANKIVDKSNITSKILGNTRKCSIYYPPSYFDNPYKKYEILLMHDGQNLFDPTKAAFGTAWMVQNTINEQTSQGKMRQIIIVGIWNTVDRNNEYTYSYDASQKFGGKGDQYLDFIEKELIPILQNQWFKDRAMKPYGIAGSSLGGLISCYAAYTRPTIYNKAVCMSSSFWWNSQDFNNQVLSTQRLLSGVQFYVDSGDSGPSSDSKNQTLAVYQHFSKIGYKTNQTLFYYLDKGGQHSESYWGKRFYISMNDLYS